MEINCTLDGNIEGAFLFIENNGRRVIPAAIIFTGVI